MAEEWTCLFKKRLSEQEILSGVVLVRPEDRNTVNMIPEGKGVFKAKLDGHESDIHCIHRILAIGDFIEFPTFPRRLNPSQNITLALWRKPRKSGEGYDYEFVIDKEKQQQPPKVGWPYYTPKPSAYPGIPRCRM